MTAKLQELEEEIKQCVRSNTLPPWITSLQSRDSQKAHLLTKDQRLQDEKRSWEALLPSSTTTTHPLSMQPTDPDTKLDSSIADPATPSAIDPTTLDPSQAAILTTLSSTTSSSLDTFHSRLRHATSQLEPQIDLLADGVHRVAQYRLAAERVADRILGAAADRLERRERAVREGSGTEGVGVGEALRGLGAVLGGSR